MKTLIAGPWSGEFGWELFAWHAYVRSLSKHYDKTIIITRKSSQDLYRDFADDFIVCEPSTGLADAFFMHGFDVKKELQRILRSEEIVFNKDTTLFIPRRIGWPPLTHYSEEFAFGDKTISPKYIIFDGHASSVEYDYIFHARNRNLRQEDNWSTENWIELVELLGGKIGCIGTKAESSHIPGTDDLRDTQLSDLFGILNNVKCAFGPSSGPMHLASLCNVPHVVWSKEDNRLRYEENWNPHRTPILFLSEHAWHPSATYVHDKFLEWRKNENSRFSVGA